MWISLGAHKSPQRRSPRSMQKNCSWFSYCRSRAGDVGRLARLTATLCHSVPEGSRDQHCSLYWRVKQQLPMAHTPDVDVHEVRAAIVPHSSAMQAQGCVTQLRRRNSS